ncbi:DUF1700 domain-containing protein [Nicoliella lavandulae]|uniref:DUF1700 domain-containing protein n=1 Tax=Nicoliella lavandulae TaxID=3082954 RepID=A0ABU8SML2_9LACO
MNRYIEELSTYLKRLDPVDLEDSIDYYSNYLEDGGFTTYNDCVTELGTPKSLANKILADDSINTIDGSRMDNKRNHNSTLSIWLIIAAIAGSPLWLPLAFGALMVIFGMIVTAIALVVSILLVVFSGFISSIIIFGWALIHLSTNFMLSLLLIGVSMISFGIVLLLIPFIIKFSKRLIHWIQKTSIWFYQKTVKRNNAEKKRG